MSSLIPSPRIKKWLIPWSLWFVIIGGVSAEGPTMVQPAEKEVMKFTPDGIVPQKLFLKGLDSSVFFLNATEESLVSFTVDFKDKRPHCASENLKFIDKKLVSVVPIGPKDFAISCFPDRGSYPVTVHGLGGDSKQEKPILGEVIVQ